MTSEIIYSREHIFSYDLLSDRSLRAWAMCLGIHGYLQLGRSELIELLRLRPRPPGPTGERNMTLRTVSELRHLARERGLRGYSRLIKDELIELLLSTTTVSAPVPVPRPNGSAPIPMDPIDEDNVEPHQPAILDYDIDTLDESEKCIICYSKRKEATIVHGNTGHFCCCLSCASILKSGGDNCPICRASIDLVIRQYN
ncbi:uncharacterized protein LOC130654088 [Hydractinia symbiolongicarpus]|uniref:uncharacterized protein LOC130654088 n=1 Tax=Hydractinia symbiolongicarpus TaxID=13093 RepID=UPI00255036C8|nr:uncharacterized protein LOC130654088 [Hydractinia symbiolongicarpus]